MEALINELEILIKVQHEYIVRHYGSRQENDVIFIFLEYMQKGSVLEDMKTNKKTYNAKATSKVTRQTLKGLEYLHSKGIVHRNVKAANILLDTEGNIKLGDFGIAKYFSQIDSSKKKTLHRWKKHLIGWHQKLVNCIHYDGTADLWSLGCTVVEMMTLKPPFKEYPLTLVIAKISNGEPPIYTLPEGSSEKIKQFLKTTLQPKSADRTSAKELLKHPFVKE